MITSEAMIVNCTMMRIEPGMRFRIKLTERFDKVSTKITAPHITIEVSSFVVTASAEQMPSTCSAIGLFSKSGSRTAFFAELAMKTILCLLMILVGVGRAES